LLQQEGATLQIMASHAPQEAASIAPVLHVSCVQATPPSVPPCVPPSVPASAPFPHDTIWLLIHAAAPSIRA
jgi:hypothetical protein